MPSKRVEEILDRVRAFHRQLGEHYAHLAEDAQDERVKFLLEYMGRHEANFNQALSKYEQGAARSLLQTWVQFGGEEVSDKVFHAPPIRADMTIEEMIEAALTLDRGLVEMYRELAEETSIEEVRNLFNDLTEMEEAKARRYSKTLLDLERF
jgi:rubrerythrin